MDELGTICKGITSNKDLYYGLAKEALIAILRQGVKNKEGSNNYEFDPAHVKDLLNFMMEQLQNTVRTLTGKSSGCRFSPITAQFAYSLWDSSPAQFRASKAILPLCLPGERQLKRIKQRNKCEDGEDIKAVQMLASQKKLMRFGTLCFTQTKSKSDIASHGIHRLVSRPELRGTCSI